MTDNTYIKYYNNELELDQDKVRFIMSLFNSFLPNSISYAAANYICSLEKRIEELEKIVEKI